MDDEKVGGGGDKKSENDCPEERERRTISESESLRGREEGPFSTIQIFDRSITKRSPTVGIFYPHLEPFHLWLKWKPRQFSTSLCQKPLTALAGRRDEALIADPIRAECGREEGRFCCPITPEINVPIVIQEREREGDRSDGTTSHKPFIPIMRVSDGAA